MSNQRASRLRFLILSAVVVLGAASALVAQTAQTAPPAQAPAPEPALTWRDVTEWGLGDDAEAATDGSHPSDLGFVRHADRFEPVLKNALAPPCLSTGTDAGAHA